MPFAVKTERMASTRASVPPAGKREIKPPVQLEDLPATRTSRDRVDLSAPLPPGSVSAPPAVVPRSESAKPAIQASWERVDQPAPLPLGSVSPPSALAVPGSESAKPAIQASQERVDRPAPAPLGSASLLPAIAVLRSESAKQREEGYVAPVLIAQEGVHTPRELLPILTRPVAVNVRVDVNEAGRVTHAEAIAEKGIHALLLNAAADAALRCRFQPARRGQSAVSSNVTIVFHIDPEKE